MIKWLNKEFEVYEGIFKSKFFHNDEDDELFIAIVKILILKNVQKNV
ncbi:hypothetical protein [Fusobacterium sp.]|nr:hypothetical protein [Fusobacterium sp.]